MTTDQWIRDLPSTWTIARLGSLGSLSKGSGGSKEDNRDSGVAVVRYGELYGKFDRIIREPQSFISPDDASRYTPLPTGTLVFAGSGEDPEEIGKAALSLLPAPAFVGGDAVLFAPRPGSVDPVYLTYVLASKPLKAYKAVRSTGFTVVHISAGKLKTLPIPLPPLGEQRAIADYLDHETDQIDALVAKQEALIRYLEERRLAVITTTALTGLQSEEPGARDVTRWGSSLAVEPWLVRAPRTWGMERFKTVCLVRQERNVAGTELMLSLTVKGHLIDRSTMAVQQNASDASLPRYFVARPNDLVVNPMWLIGGAIGVSDKRGAVSPDYRVFEIDERLDPWYLHAVLRSAPYFDQYKLYTRSNTTFDRRIKQNDLDNLPLPIPPLGEQRAIVEHIGEQTGRIDALIAKAEEHIALAKERRSALITAAVTGQVHVRTARKAR